MLVFLVTSFLGNPQYPGLSAPGRHSCTHNRQATASGSRGASGGSPNSKRLRRCAAKAYARDRSGLFRRHCPHTRTARDTRWEVASHTAHWIMIPRPMRYHDSSGTQLPTIFNDRTDLGQYPDPATKPRDNRRLRACRIEGIIVTSRTPEEKVGDGGEAVGRRPFRQSSEQECLRRSQRNEDSPLLQ